MSERLILGAHPSRVNAPAILLILISLACVLPILGPRLAVMAIELPLAGVGPHLANSDFVNYWMAGKLAFGGEALLLFDPQAYFDRLKQMFGEDYPPHNRSYPPHAVLVFGVFGLLPYKAAMIAFFASTLILYAWAAELFRRRFAPAGDAVLYWSAHLAYVALNVAAAQNGFLTGALLLLFLVWADRRPVLAGVCLGVLTIKPQLGLLIPPLLVFARLWTAIFWAVLFTLLLTMLSAATFDLEAWIRYVEVVMPFQHSVMTEWSGVMLLMMPTVSSGLRLLGFGSEFALAVQTLFILLCLPFVIHALWRHAADPLRRAVALTIGTFLAAPYSFNYDMGAVVTTAAALLAVRPEFRSAVISAMLCLLPVAVMLAGLAQFPLAPLALLAGFLALAGNGYRDATL